MVFILTRYWLQLAGFQRVCSPYCRCLSLRTQATTTDASQCQSPQLWTRLLQGSPVPEEGPSPVPWEHAVACSEVPGCSHLAASWRIRRA